jgi:hypothetical protein
MVYINRAWIARIKEDSSSLNIRFPDTIFLFIPNIILSLAIWNMEWIITGDRQPKMRGGFDHDRGLSHSMIFPNNHHNPVL